MFRVTRQYRFSASHRLHSAELSDEQNQLLYGKCNNPYGHGHNYVVEVSARGPLDRHGRTIDLHLLDELVRKQVVDPLEHCNLNLDVEAFRDQVPTSENLAKEICRRLKHNWRTVFPEPWPRLEKIRIAETPRNIFEIRTDEIE